ncbi:hypothetical protein ACFX1S_026465 [Malus domestica]
MIPTPGWKLEPLCFGTISPKRGIPPPLLEDMPCQMLRQLLNFDITVEEEVLELMLPKHAQAWIDEFVCQIGGNKKDLPGPSNFHINMTYVLSVMFCAEPDQLPRWRVITS